jgi:hypothetical protein
LSRDSACIQPQPTRRERAEGGWEALLHGAVNGMSVGEDISRCAVLSAVISTPVAMRSTIEVSANPCRHRIRTGWLRD